MMSENNRTRTAAKMAAVHAAAQAMDERFREFKAKNPPAVTISKDDMIIDAPYNETEVQVAEALVIEDMHYTRVG